MVYILKYPGHVVRICGSSAVKRPLHFDGSSLPRSKAKPDSSPSPLPLTAQLVGLGREVDKTQEKPVPFLCEFPEVRD